jgi:hypothetical protein
MAIRPLIARVLKSTSRGVPHWLAEQNHRSILSIFQKQKECLMKSTTHRVAIVAMLIFAFVAPHAQGTMIAALDDFSDGGVVLNSSGSVVGSEGASSALGSWRAFIFNSSFNSSTLTLDDAAGTLRIDSTGLGQTTLGYGLRLSGGGALVGTTLTALNVDLSNHLGLRFNILENPSLSGQTRMRLSVSLRTDGGGISSITQFGLGILPTNGPFDLLFADIPATSGGGVDLTNVDTISITIQNGFVGNSVAIGPIELIPIPVPEPGTHMLLFGGAMLWRRRFGSRAR